MAPHLMRLAEEQLPGDSVKDVGGDVALCSIGLPRLRPSSHEERVGVQVLQLQAAIAQHLRPD